MEKSRRELEIGKSADCQIEGSKKNKGDTIVELTKAALLTAVFCILAPHTLYLPFGPVGITLGSFLLYLTGLLLGPKSGCISVGIYLCLGFLGIPVFSGYTAGAGVLFGPTGGFLIGYLPAVVLVGCLTKKASRGRKGIMRFLFAMLAGTLVLYVTGTLWFIGVYTKGVTFTEALTACVLPFLPFDGVKIGLATILYQPFYPLKYRNHTTYKS